MSCQTPSIPNSPSSSRQTLPSSRPQPRPRPQKLKSKSLSLPPLPPLPRRITVADPTSPSKRRLSTPRDPLLTMPSTCHETSQVLSPSRLPATDSMSYFPPFEDMGSTAPASPPEHASCVAMSRSSSGAGETRATHGKNRSLGNIASYLSWAAFSPTSEVPPSQPELPASKSTGSEALTDGERVRALARRFTASQSQSRVLEPIAIEESNRAISLLGLTTGTRVEPQGVVTHRKRNDSEVDVERMLKAGKEGRSNGDDDAMAVERIVGYTPFKSNRQGVSLLPNSMPNFRFPFPSPPLAALSPHIPVEFFQFEVSNPASASTSPTKSLSTFSDLHERELDEIEGSLLSLGFGSHSDSLASMCTGTTQDTAPSHPITPDCSHSPKAATKLESPLYTPSPRSPYSFNHKKTKGRFSMAGDEEAGAERLEMLFPEKVKLRRTSSSGSKASCDSNATIKARQGDMTPKAGRGWRAVHAG